MLGGGQNSAFGKNVVGRFPLASTGLNGVAPAVETEGKQLLAIGDFARSCPQLVN